MLAQMDLIVVADDAAGAVRKFFLQHKVGPDVNALGNCCSLNLGAGRPVALQLDWLLVDADGDDVFLRIRCETQALIKANLLVVCDFTMSAAGDPPPG